MPDALVDEVALVGPRERIAERLEAWREAGVTTLLCSTQQDEALELLAELVAVTHVRELFDLGGKVAIVTGGGTGHRPADGAGARRARRRPRPLRAQGRALRAGRRGAARELGVRALGLRCDVARPGRGRRRSSRDARAEFGRIDILVNNAGTVWGAPPEDMPLEGWQKVVDVNLTGAFLCSQAVGRVLIEQGEGGRIVNIASVAGLRGAPAEVMNTIVYHATKGGLIAFTRDLAWKWARHGITVNAIAPGLVPVGHVPLRPRPAGRLVPALDPARPLRRAGRPQGRGRLPRLARVGLRHRARARRRRRPERA